MTDHNFNDTDLPKTTGVPQNIQDISGKTYNRWSVIGFSRTFKNHSYWVCRCDCGIIRVVERYQITSGRSKSCGCLRNELYGTHNKKHNLSYNAAYFCWHGMISRCYNEQDPSFERYGGRGITVCDRWHFGKTGRYALECFIEDMGERPSPEHTLDRIDNKGNYEPKNVRWATKEQQANNRSCVNLIAYDGKEMSIAQWAKFLNINSHLIRDRMRRGWDFSSAINIPING